MLSLKKLEHRARLRQQLSELEKYSKETRNVIEILRTV